MIVTPTDGRLRIITQHDHAHFASELLSLWHTDGLPTHPRRRHLLYAAREHDNGWREADSAPHCRQANGRPHDFVSVPQALRREIWHRGVLRHLDKEPYAARLIVRHALHLHREHQDDADWRETLGAWQQLATDLLDETLISEQDFENDYRWIVLTDSLSLAACDPRWKKLSTRGVTAELLSAEPEDALSGQTLSVQTLSGQTLTLDPFPLAGTTTLHIACRLIPDRRYHGDADLGTELATAPWQRYAVRIAPADAVANRI